MYAPAGTIWIIYNSVNRLLSIAAMLSASPKQFSTSGLGIHNDVDPRGPGREGTFTPLEGRSARSGLTAELGSAGLDWLVQSSLLVLPHKGCLIQLNWLRPLEDSVKKQHESINIA